MPRTTRFCPPGVPQHVIQRGNNRQPTFKGRVDFAFYCRLMEQYAEEHGVALHGWVLMTNHVHLLATPSTEKSLSAYMQSIGRRYVRYFNRRHDRTGGLWEGRFRSCLIDSENYLLGCQRYIEMNPVSAGMVSNPEDYWWSSYQCHALGKTSEMHSPHPLYQALGNDQSERQRRYRQLFASPMPDFLKDQIRKTVKSGKTLGSIEFKSQLKAKYGISD
ncbi:transposase [Marinobacter sp. Arc7-DN-1]|uniref:transposase n=1 Tax=Marinobacter sp. Arc7-DN-1 TaxID=2304594 RepID=UPI000E43A48A|nr:transposase [Marinobacter sp. Arc7-DN-1]AXS82491.1 transposase [Marinobacter sp. Arc7-DN-1]